MGRLGIMDKHLKGYPDFRIIHPNIELRKMYDTSELVTHDFFALDYDIVWNITTQKMPSLYLDVRKYYN